MSLFSVPAVTYLGRSVALHAAIDTTSHAYGHWSLLLPLWALVPAAGVIISVTDDCESIILIPVLSLWTCIWLSIDLQYES